VSPNLPLFAFALDPRVRPLHKTAKEEICHPRSRGADPDHYCGPYCARIRYASRGRSCAARERAVVFHPTFMRCISLPFHTSCVVCLNGYHGLLTYGRTDELIHIPCCCPRNVELFLANPRESEQLIHDQPQSPPSIFCSCRNSQVSSSWARILRIG
jgi:hypothetical protein